MSEKDVNVSVNETEQNVVTDKAAKRGTIIQAVKAMAVLLIICLICGALLALCNDLMYIDDNEKFNRAMSKIAPGFTKDGDFAEEPVEQFAKNDLYGEVRKVYKSADTDNPSYVMLVKGANVGYGDGNVTIYVAVSADTENPVILGWSIVENEGQTFIGNIKESHTKKWFIGSSVSELQSTNSIGSGLGSGATMSENSIISAINMACYYSMNALGLGENPEKDALNAILQLLGENFANAQSTTLNTKSFAHLSTEAETLEYVFAIENASKNYYGLAYANGENKVYVVVQATALDIDRTAVVAKSENASDDLANKAAAYYFTDLAYITDVKTDGGKKIYTVTGNPLPEPTAYTLEVTVTDDGKVEKCDIKVDGVYEGWGGTSEMAVAVVGKTLADLNDGFYNFDTNKGQFEGATKSAEIIFRAVRLVLTHFEANK